MPTLCATCAKCNNGCPIDPVGVTHCGQYTMNQRDTRPAPLEREIREECMLLADFLVAKNRAYGNSASEPTRIFAKRADPLLQIDVRIDDKLNRLIKGTEYPGDNDIKDLAGYLVLRMIVEKQQKAEGQK